MFELKLGVEANSVGGLSFHLSENHFSGSLRRGVSKSNFYNHCFQNITPHIALFVTMTQLIMSNLADIMKQLV